VRLIVITACITGSAAVSAQGADRWPLNVCREIAFEEWLQDIPEKPEYRAIARALLLRLLQEHCGFDTRAKMKADENFVRNALRDGDKRRRRVDGLPAWDETEPMPDRRHRTCTRDLGGGLATTNCN
jgi:hypothetical protein